MNPGRREVGVPGPNMMPLNTMRINPGAMYANAFKGFQVAPSMPPHAGHTAMMLPSGPFPMGNFFRGIVPTPNLHPPMPPQRSMVVFPKPPVPFSSARPPPTPAPPRIQVPSPLEWLKANFFCVPGNVTLTAKLRDRMQRDQTQVRKEKQPRKSAAAVSQPTTHGTQPQKATKRISSPEVEDTTPYVPSQTTPPQRKLPIIPKKDTVFILTPQEVGELSPVGSGNRNKKRAVAQAIVPEDNVTWCRCGETLAPRRGGFEVCCDACSTWQHSDCVGIFSKEEAEKITYYCYRCKDEHSQLEIAHEDTIGREKHTEKPSSAVPRTTASQKEEERAQDWLFNDDIVDCVCGEKVDIGFMIECDLCAKWEHGMCIGITNPEKAPKTHRCTNCRKQKARAQRREEKHKRRRVAIRDQILNSDSVGF